MISKEKVTNDNIEVLIAEDSPTQAEQLTYLLEQNGYQPSVASNGAEALLFLKERKPSLVISDILMPEMDGFELCRKIREDENLKELPVILLTSLSDPLDIIEGLKCGADNFITKPYKEEFLLSRLKHLLINRELRKDADSDMGIKVFFKEQKHQIVSSSTRMLDLILSIYEDAFQKNQELKQVNEELKEAQDKLKAFNAQLEETVMEKTTSLKEKIADNEQMLGRLRTVSQQWYTTFNAIVDGICVLDTEAKVLQCNKAMEELTGKPIEEMVGWNCCELVHGAPGHLEGCPMVRMRKSFKRESLELNVEETWLQVTVDPILDGEGKLVGTVHVIVNITERKRVE